MRISRLKYRLISFFTQHVVSETQNNLSGVTRNVCESFIGLRGLSRREESSITTLVLKKSKKKVFILFLLLDIYITFTGQFFYL